MGRFSWIALALTSLMASTAHAAVTWTATPFNPASVPLAVRTPYLSTWLPQGAGASLAGTWPAFWTGSTLGWAGYVKVDGTTYTFLGAPAVAGTTLATQKSSSFTATQSKFVLTAGGIDLTATFLSPVEPNDLVKQSTPFSYLSLVATPNDGKSHTVQVYTDISAEWITGDNGLTATWSTSTGSILTHQVQLQTQTNFAEINDHIQHGSAYYSTPNTVGATYQSGSDTAVRTQFVNNGRLANTQDTNFRAVNNAWPVFGLAHDLGTISGASAPVVFSIGHVRDPVIRFRRPGNVLQPRSAYFWTKYSTVAALIADFLNDYSSALSRANTLDAKVQSDASKISSNYAALVALSIRQSLATVEITVSKTSTGAWNTSDVLTFMKEISSNGNMNTVDVIFPAWPIYMYLQPDWAKYLLMPLFQYQASGEYPNKWSIHDLGAHYPTADAHNNGGDEAMPVEESGNMLIMALSYTQKTNDQSLIKTYGLLDQWTQFLIQDSLIPADQLSTDDFAGHLANQTNLAIKGIIGIKASAAIQSLLGNTAKSSNYSSIASSYVTKFTQLAASASGRHLTLQYGNTNSWGMTYNLWADKHLKLNLFPASIYSQQTAWYKTVQQAYGLPLDTRHPTSWTKSDWEIFTAGTVTDTAVRDFLIDSVVKYASSGKNNVPLSDWYDASTGVTNGFQARPVVGGHLALLV